MKNLALFIIVAMAAIGCKKESTVYGSAVYLVRSDSAGLDVTYYYRDDHSQSLTSKYQSLTTEFRAKSGDMLQVFAQSKNQNNCVTTYIIFNGDTVVKTPVCGNYMVSKSTYVIPYQTK